MQLIDEQSCAWGRNFAMNCTYFYLIKMASEFKLRYQQCIEVSLQIALVLMWAIVYMYMTFPALSD